MRDTSPACIGMQIHTREAKSGRQKSGGGFAVRPEGFAVENQFSVEFSRAPRLEDSSDGVFVHAESISQCGHVGRKIDDGADVKIAIGPSIQPIADARHEGIVHGRVAESALNTERSNLSCAIKKASHAHHGVEL